MSLKHEKNDYFCAKIQTSKKTPPFEGGRGMFFLFIFFFFRWKIVTFPYRF
jgi:hypothetical protein